MNYFCFHVTAHLLDVKNCIKNSCVYETVKIVKPYLGNSVKMFLPLPKPFRLSRQGSYNRVVPSFITSAIEI